MKAQALSNEDFEKIHALSKRLIDFFDKSGIDPRDGCEAMLLTVAMQAAHPSHNDAQKEERVNADMRNYAAYFSWTIAMQQGMSKEELEKMVTKRTIN